MVLGIENLPKIFLLCLAMLYVSVTEGSEIGGGLKVCLLEDNLPYSSRHAKTGFDYDVGNLLAERLDEQFIPVWISNSRQILEIEGDYPFRRLVNGGCSLILSVPGPVKKMGEGNSPAIMLGDAYYGAAFEVLSRSRDGALSFKSLKGRKVAIMSQTVAHFALPKIGATPTTYFSVKEALLGLSLGEADAGLLWGPTSGWLLSKLDSGENPIKRLKEGLPPAALSWNIHFATRLEDAPLRTRVSAALQEFRESGQLSRLMDYYHFPDRQPFKVTHSPSTFHEL